MNNDNQRLLTINNLSVNFGDGHDMTRAVIDLNLEIRQGEVVGLIGESGSGKTTTAHAILGLIDGIPGICSGQVDFQSKPLLPEASRYIKTHKGRIHKKSAAYQKSQRRLLQPFLGREIAAIFQEPKSALNPFLSIKAHLTESIKRSGLNISNPEKYGQDMLSQVGIIDSPKIWSHYPHQLSGGMAQRVMIAMALCCNPRLLIADEPTTALDVTTQAKLLELFLKFKKNKNLSILIISHDIGVIREVAERVYVMYNGRIVEQGNIADIIYKPRDDYTKKLLMAFHKLSSVA